ncbi:MAG: alpha/beta hydrolase [Bacteroidetes bacterium]|nr:alpha/beta hydrolase [Bacteroidota bacterium]
MQTIYCISGLGADKGAFLNLDLSFANPVFIDWISPEKNETLRQYAKRLQQQYIKEENPVIVGLSLGGMVATEIAKRLPDAIVIIVSSAKTKNEIPYYLKTFRYLPLHKTLPEWILRQHTPLREYLLGAKNKDCISYVKYVAQHADGNFYRWAVSAILHWENTTIPSNVVHLHGTNDKLLPYRFVKSHYTILNGGHLMIIENSIEVSQMIKAIIKNKTALPRD